MDDEPEQEDMLEKAGVASSVSLRADAMSVTVPDEEARLLLTEEHV